MRRLKRIRDPKLKRKPKYKKDQKLRKLTVPARTIYKKRFVETTDINDARFMEYYQLFGKYKRKDLPAEDVKRIARFFFKKMKEKMLHNEAGVFIKNFGYFCFVRYPQRQIVRRRKKKKIFTNYHTEGHLYSPTFIPIRKDTALREWSMEGSFYFTLRKKMSDLLISGKKYKMAFSLLHNMYGHASKKTNLIKFRDAYYNNTAQSGD